MSPIRVLVVDDSAVVRRLVTAALSNDPDIEVVGTAANGRIALTELDELVPDAVTLDVEMPEMDGLETLSAIRERRPTLPVIMFSGLTERGAAITIEALARGATDYVTKSAYVGSVRAAIASVREQLVPRLHALCPGRVADQRRPPHASGRRPTPLRPVLERSGPAAPPAVLAIGASTGGPVALTDVLAALPGDLPVPVVLVQHMPPVFTAPLAARLDRMSQLHVREAVDGAPLVPGDCWVAPGGRHLTVSRSAHGASLRLDDGPPEHSARPSVDVLFRSVLAAFGAGTVAAVLTGMGEDGARAAQAIHHAGGYVVVQDEATSVVWGMPGAVVRSGSADRVVPLPQVAPALVRATSVVGAVRS